MPLRGCRPLRPLGARVLAAEEAAAAGPGPGGGPPPPPRLLLRGPPSAAAADGSLVTVEEAVVRGRHVVWAAGGVVKRRLALDGDVRDAAWARFDTATAAAPHWLCCLAQDQLHLCGSDGADSVVAAPPGAAGVWPLGGRGGLALQGGDGAVHVLRGALRQLERAAWGLEAAADGGPWLIAWTGAFAGRDLALVHSPARRQHRLLELAAGGEGGSGGADGESARGLWEGPARDAEAATAAFVGGDGAGGGTLYVVASPEVRGVVLRVTAKGGLAAAGAFALPGVAATPLHALELDGSRPAADDLPRELVVLEPSGALALYAGRLKLCRLGTADAAAAAGSGSALDPDGEGADGDVGSDGDAPMETETATGAADRVVDVRDGIRSHFTLEFASGATVRAGVRLSPAVEPTRRALGALRLALPEGPFFELYVRWLGRGGAASGALEREWGSFRATLLEWLDREGGSGAGAQTARQTDWEFLVATLGDGPGFPCLAVGGGAGVAAGSAEPARRPTSRHAVDVLDALHSVYEDSRLDVFAFKHLDRLQRLLVAVCRHCGERGRLHRVRYDRDARLGGGGTAAGPGEPPAGVVPDVYKVLLSCVRPEQDAELAATFIPTLLAASLEGPPGAAPACVRLSHKTCRIYRAMAASAAAGGQEGRHTVVGEIVALGWTRRDLDRLPFGVAVPILELLHGCRVDPPAGLGASAYLLLGRQDLAATCPAGGDAPGLLHVPYGQKLWPKTSAEVDFTLNLEDVDAGDSSVVSKKSTSVNEKNSCDGMEGLDEGIFRLRFGRDPRLQDVRAMLSSNVVQPVAIKTNQDPGDPELFATQQARLWNLGMRTMALPAGRGAFALGSLTPLPTEPVQIPQLNLSGRLPHQNNANISLEFPSPGPSAQEVLVWPEFHNGIAAGIRLAAGQASLSRTWIVYNKPSTASHEYAGMLMAFGLQGHLKCLAATDLFHYLSQEHDTTTIGVLLGVSAARCGSMDATSSKMLFLHIPARHPTSYPELELSTSVQAAALMGVGLLYLGSAHPLMTNILLEEIGRRPSADGMEDREGYSLAAGLAVGLVNLGKGDAAASVGSARVQDRLLTLMRGKGGDPHRAAKDGRGANFLDAELGIDSDAPRWHPSHHRLEDLNGTTSSQVMEANMVNLDVTAPGATLALGLIYLKTNNASVADRLQVPDTHYALAFMRPDFILLRVLARSLILWDSIRPSAEWVEGQVPAFIRRWVKPNGSPTEEILDDTRNGTIDFEAVLQAHMNTLAGACMALGLKYAGSADQAAQETLAQACRRFLKLKQGAPEISMMGVMASTCGVDKTTLEGCLNVAALALALVMAGTGHLPTYRLLRVLRNRVGGGAAGSLTYGNHMAISMAVGFLFLGGGTYSFGTDDRSIAVLLISLFPRFPSSPQDNRSHLQAFRHLYVLATEQRCAQAIDVDTWQPVFCPVELSLRGGGGDGDGGGDEKVTLFTPCLLPERSEVAALRVVGPRYWQQEMDFAADGAAAQRFFGHRTLFVKRKIGMLPYTDDPNGSRSLLARAFDKGSTAEQAQELVRMFSADPYLRGFVDEMCHEDGDGPEGADSRELRRFCRSAIFECVTHEKAELLPLYMDIYVGVQKLLGFSPEREPAVDAAAAVLGLNGGSGPLLTVWNLRLLHEYYATARAGEPTLIGTIFVAAVWQQVETLFEDLGGDELLAGGGAVPADEPGADPQAAQARALLLGAFLNVLSVPPDLARRLAAAGPEDVARKLFDTRPAHGMELDAIVKVANVVNGTA